MTPTTLAELIADCHDAQAGSKRQALVALFAAALAGGTGGLLFGDFRSALAVAGVAGVVCALVPALRGLAAMRRLKRLAAEHPALFPIALERYRMVMASDRASRYKLFC